MTATTSNPPSRASRTEVALAADPFTALAYSFGMLLGVDDFEVEQAYHRGKHRLHAAWLHGKGVVWGFEIKILDNGEVQIEPGLALDAIGRELRTRETHCARLLDWYRKHKQSSELQSRMRARLERSSEIDCACPAHAARPQLSRDSAVTFDLQLVVRFSARATRPRPLVEPHSDATSTLSAASTALSRIEEHVELFFRPPETSAGEPQFAVRAGARNPYPRVRRLVRPLESHEQSDRYGSVERWRRLIRRTRPEQRTQVFMRALRELSYEDQQENGWRPLAYRQDEGEHEDASELYRDNEDTELLLGEIRGIVIDDDRLLDHGRIHSCVRPVLLPTASIQDLLCGILATVTGPRDAGGPRVRRVNFRGKRLIIEFTHPILPISSSAFSVAEWRDGLWHKLDIQQVLPAVEEDYEIEQDVYVLDEVEWDVEDGEILLELRKERVRIAVGDEDWSQVTLELAHQPRGKFIRVVAYGTGAHPIINANGVPLAGGIPDGPAGPVDGRDYVLQARRGDQD